MFLKNETITEVRKSVKIYDAVSDSIPLKGTGNEFFGQCPFHEDKTPSLSVTPNKNLWYCFSCGAGGDAIRFVEKTQTLEFTEAVLYLARKFNIPIQYADENAQKEFEISQSRKEKLYEIMQLASQYYHHTLLKNKKALEYLTDFRKINLETIKDFNLGYAPDNREGLLNYLLDKLPTHKDLFLDSGLILKSKIDETHIDFFRSRIIIPIHNQQGRVIAFGGRHFNSNSYDEVTPNTPKYLNSPETELFGKSRTLFAFDKAFSNIKNNKINSIIFTEGYLDAIKLHQHGFKNSVAVLGAAITKPQLLQCKKLTDNFYLNLDNDNAGSESCKKFLKEFLSEINKNLITVKILKFPDSIKDPDSFLSKYSAEQYQQTLDSALNWIDWLSHQIVKDKDLTNSKTWKICFNELAEILRELDGIDKINYHKKFSAILSKGNPENIDEIHGMLAEKITNIEKVNTRKIVKISPFKHEQKALSPFRETERTILLIYLYVNDYIIYRPFIREQFYKRDIDFTTSYRHIWRKINELEPESLDDEQNLDVEIKDDLLDLIKQSSDFNLLDYDDIININENEIFKILSSNEEDYDYYENIIISINLLEKLILEKRKEIAFNQWKANGSDESFSILREIISRIRDIEEYRYQLSV